MPEHIGYGDIDPFLLAINNPTAYEQQYPNCDRLRADINGDGYVNNGDIDAFLTLIGTATGGSGVLDRLFAYDAENRLIAVDPVGDPTDGDLRLHFTYDHLGRRVRKLVEEYNAAQQQWQTVADVKFVYHGWRLIMELVGLNDPSQGGNRGLSALANAGAVSGKVCRLAVCHGSVKP